MKNEKMDEINMNNLFHQKSFFSGNWKNSSDGETIDVFNPATNKIIGSVPSLSDADILEAVNSAQSGFKIWQAKTAMERATVLKKWYNLVLENSELLAQILTAEQGKPIKEARVEIGASASFIEWYAEEARRVYGDIIPSPLPDRKTIVTREPVGVCAAITPWNFPASMLARKVAPALAAGCAIIVKPSEETPFTSLGLADLAKQAGVPDGVFSVVTGNSKKIVKVMTDSHIVRKLSFTGSTEVGKLLISQCASTVKRMSMELGGNAPVLIFEDADVDAAVKGIMALKFRNAGQTCVCANRIFIHSAILADVLDKLIPLVKALNIGEGKNEATDIGPLINQKAASQMKRILARAVEQGAEVLTGENDVQFDETNGCYFAPTILLNVNEKFDIANSEIFGPIASIISFDDEEAVIRSANNTEYGLASYIYTKDLARSWRVSDALEYGMVGINEVAISNEVAPFGGVKESGFGREGSKYGIDEYLNLKYRCIGGLNV